MEIWENLETQFDPTLNNSAYREALKNAKLPVLPYLNLHLTDLLYIDEGNSDKIQSPNGIELINFSKYLMIASVVSNVLQYRDIPVRTFLFFLKKIIFTVLTFLFFQKYALKPVSEIQNYLLHPPNLIEDNEKLYQLSLLREPKKRKN